MSKIEQTPTPSTAPKYGLKRSKADKELIEQQLNEARTYVDELRRQGCDDRTISLYLSALRDTMRYEAEPAKIKNTSSNNSNGYENL